MSLNTTPITWVSGNVVTAAQLNAEIRDAITGLQAAWTAYTPTLTNITLGNGTLVFGSSRVGKTVNLSGYFTAGTTTSYSAGTLGFSLPFAPNAARYTTPVNSTAIGSAFIQPAAASRWPGTVYIDRTSGLINFLAGSAANAIVTNTVPAAFTAATTSAISFSATYEAA